METQFNKYQSSIESLNLNKYPIEIQEQFMDFINNVPFIKYLISPDRPYFKDLPRDSEGKAIIDITKPPILTDMDYFRPAALHFQLTGKFTNMRPNPNPNSEYGKWVREEVRRCYKGYVRESDGAWVTGDLYWFLNYWPIMQTRFKEGSKKGDRVVDFPEVWDGIFYRYNYIDQAINGGLYNTNGGNNGCEISSRGKAHPYSLEIYTPKGKLLWKDISIGDYIYGDDGNLTKVIDIPFDNYCDVYEITLKDGRKVKASGNHLWRVYRRYSHCFKTMSTYEMMLDFVKKRKPSDRNKGVEYIYAIPANKGVEWNYKQVSIDPYTFGLCLGDGCFRTEKLLNNIYYTSLEEDMCTYLRYVPYDIVKLKTESGYFIRIPNAKHILVGWGLHMKKSEDKFIPNEYKYNSREVRLNILKGLMDSDGFVDSNGVPIIGVSSKQLADDIVFISRSLGYNCLLSVKKSGYKINGVYKKCLDNYIVRIYTSDVLFNLERKQKLVSKFESTYSKSNRDFSTIVDIRKTGYEKCKCISVDNESQCYLIGDFITTHNSKSYTMSAMMGKRFVLGESELVNKRVKCMATAYLKQFLTSDGIMNKFLAGIDFLALNTQFPSRRLKSSLQEMTWKMGYRDLDTGTDRGTLNEVIGVSAKDDISKVRGKRQNLIVVEEFGAFRNVLELYNIMIPSVQEGDISFGSMYLVGCVCAGTKVFDKDNNLINIEDANSSIIGYNGKEASVEDITYIQPEAYKECVEIVTTNGNIKCSIDHPLLKLNKDNFTHSKGSCSFYRANELKVGDILLMHGNDRFGTTKVKDAYLLGALFGDGNYSYNSCTSLSITTEEEYDYYNTNYSIGISKLRNTAKGGLYALIYFRGIRSLLKKYNMNGQSFDKKRLPYNIWLWDKLSIADFLAGYFDADGNVQIVKTKHRSIKLTCKYKESLEQISILLLKFNIFSYILEENKPSRILHSVVNSRDYVMKECKAYVLYICNGIDIIRFRDNIKLKIKYKKERLDSYVFVKGRNCFESLDFVYRDENKKGKYFIGKKLLNLKGTKIISINNIGIRRVYNLTANTTHTYISNGFVSSNTSGDSESDFAGALEIVYNPKGYRMYGIPNVYDKEGLGRREITFFFPGYLNRKGCYDKDGNSDVTKALLEILEDRYRVKYNSTDLNSITRTIAEIPVTPQEALLRTKGNIFPVTQLNERLNEIDNNPNFYDDVWCGELVLNKGGNVEFRPSNDMPIRNYPLNDNTEKGCLEIYVMPEKNKDGKVFNDRYCLGYDPYDNDQGDSLSLGSVHVLDLFTDKLVAEYTGRTTYAEEFYEVVRLLCLFYNGKVMYESNLKGCFAYFSKMNCTHLLADTPEYLRDKQIIKYTSFGNNAKGIRATAAINNYADALIKEWLIKPIVTIVKEEGEEKEVTVPNLFFIRNRALLKELVAYNPFINVDRVRALGMLMLYRLEKIILYQGDMTKTIDEDRYTNSAENDEFFLDNFDRRFNSESNILD